MWSAVRGFVVPIPTLPAEARTTLFGSIPGRMPQGSLPAIAESAVE